MAEEVKETKKRTVKTISVDDRITNAELIIKGIRNNPEMKSAIGKYGIGDTELVNALLILERTIESVNAQKKEYSEQYKAVEEFNSAKGELDTLYMKDVKIARIAFENDSEKETLLNLKGSRNRAYSSWISELRTFYDNALGNSEVTETLSEFGLTDEKLKGRRTLVDNVSEKRITAEKEKAEAVAATDARDARIAELEDFVSDLKLLAKVAFKGNNEWFSKLGM